MQIITRCPHCSTRYKVATETVGRQAKCKCGQVFIIIVISDTEAQQTGAGNHPRGAAAPAATVSSSVLGDTRGPLGTKDNSNYQPPTTQSAAATSTMNNLGCFVPVACGLISILLIWMAFGWSLSGILFGLGGGLLIMIITCVLFVVFLGPKVPHSLLSNSDFEKLEKVLRARGFRTLEALRLVEETGPSAIRAAPIVKSLLEDKDFRLAAARALWRVERYPESANFILQSLGSAESPNTEALEALSVIVKDDHSHANLLLSAARSLIDALAASRNKADFVDRTFNALTSGGDNSTAREIASTLARVAWDHEEVKNELANVIAKPANVQQGKYASLALGFASYHQRDEMEKDLSSMNIFFDHPDITMIAARNTIRDAAIAAGVAAASGSKEK
ncbi:MAG: hypothetical protein AMXMBFR16_12120 [Candidatus Uhrbacteria bacterium]